MARTDAPWLDQMIARLGVHEIPGKKHNPMIIGWFHDIGHPEINDDETAWCATAVSHCLWVCGYPTTPVNLNMWARSYLTYGKRTKPVYGALAIWPRGKSKSQGHINIVEDVREHNGRIQVRCIGGNQGGFKSGDAVTRTGWRDASEALDFRWPIKPTVKDLRAAGSTEIKQADALETASATTTAVGASAAVVHEAIKATPDVSSLPQIIPEGATDHIGMAQQVMEAMNGLVGVVKENPWLAVVLFVSLGGFWVARLWKAGRLNRHLMGLPLSVEAEGSTNA